MLFIKMNNGLPEGHPITYENLLEIYPDLNINNLPTNFAKFVRADLPVLNRFEVYNGATYEWNGLEVVEVHHTRPMTEEEKNAEVEKIKQMRPNEHWTWDETNLTWTHPRATSQNQWMTVLEPPFPSWVLSKSGLRYLPPKPIPQDGRSYVWNEDKIDWDLMETQSNS